MLIRDVTKCKEIIAGDKTVLRELLHTDKIPNANFRYSLAHATVKVGEKSTLHALRVSEVYFL